MLSREDEESRLYELELLEQLANRLAMAESRDILGEFEPSQYIAVLGRVVSRPVQIFPDVPVLATRCTKVSPAAPLRAPWCPLALLEALVPPASAESNEW
jgi:hypothetical protein